MSIRKCPTHDKLLETEKVEVRVVPLEFFGVRMKYIPFMKCVSCDFPEVLHIVEFHIKKCPECNFTQTFRTNIEGGRCEECGEEILEAETAN